MVFAGTAFAQEDAASDTASDAVQEAVAEDAAPAGTTEAVEETASAFTKIPLWPDKVPSKTRKDDKDWPTLTLYLLKGATGPRPAVVICPGGGYGHLAMDHEGHQIAQWLNAMGVHGIILEYRHAPLYNHPVPMMDAEHAMRTARARADEWNIDPNRIGIIGFSAGGHLASTIATHFDEGSATSTDPIKRVSSRPDFAILVYPVITFQNDYTHRGSRKNLIGDNPDPSLIELYSNERQIQPFTPPTFLVHSSDDKVVPVENSLRYFQELSRQGISAEMHIYQYGGHGYGMAPNDPILHSWTKRCEDWMRHRGLLK